MGAEKSVIIGMSYEMLLEKYIFKPTGIKNCAIVLSESQKKLRGKGYNPNGKQMPHGLEMPVRQEVLNQPWLIC